MPLLVAVRWRLPISAELRHVVRSLRRAPWFATTVVGVMALAMMLATVVFAIVDGVLFRPLLLPRFPDLPIPR